MIKTNSHRWQTQWNTTRGRWGRKSLAWALQQNKRHHKRQIMRQGAFLLIPSFTIHLNLQPSWQSFPYFFVLKILCTSYNWLHKSYRGTGILYQVYVFGRKISSPRFATISIATRIRDLLNQTSLTTPPNNAWFKNVSTSTAMKPNS